MTEGQTIEITDDISGYCPACNQSDIEIACTSIIGNQREMVRKYTLRCKHQTVCKLRYDFMEKNARRRRGHD